MENYIQIFILNYENLTVINFSINFLLADSSARIAAFCFTNCSFLSMSCLMSVSWEKESDRICASSLSGLGWV